MAFPNWWAQSLCLSRKSTQQLVFFFLTWWGMGQWMSVRNAPSAFAEVELQGPWVILIRSLLLWARLYRALCWWVRSLSTGIDACAIHCLWLSVHWLSVLTENAALLLPESLFVKWPHRYSFKSRHVHVHVDTTGTGFLLVNKKKVTCRFFSFYSYMHMLICIFTYSKLVS